MMRNGMPHLRRNRFCLRLLGVLILFGTTLSALLLQAEAAEANDELLVFISAFAKGDEGAIHAYRLDVAAGKLTPLARTGGIESPFFMALAPDNKYLYATRAAGAHGGGENEDIYAYELLGDSGKLKFLNSQSSLGTASCYLDVDETGKTVVVANYQTGSVAALPINEDGSISKATTFVQHEGSSADPSRQEGPHAHAALISPDNRHLFVPDLGLDQIVSYQLFPRQAKLKPASQPFVRTAAGAGPRHLTFHPNGKHLYVINELADTVTMFDYYAATGMLIEQQTVPTLPEDADGDKSWTADLKVTPDGKFLFGTNRGHDSLASYKLDDEGRLALLAIQPSGGKSPQSLAITPGGELLMCANMGSGEVTLFRIDQATGSLTQVGGVTKLPSPSCIQIVR